MKTKLIILLGAVLCIVACTDSSEVRGAKGAYRYKTTGKVTLEDMATGKISVLKGT